MAEVTAEIVIMCFTFVSKATAHKPTFCRLTKNLHLSASVR